jgi:pimeloyl-ACP methyl ester carboxylesterase
MSQTPTKTRAPAPAFSEAAPVSTGWLIAGAGAAALGATALFNRIAAKRAEAANPPAGKFVEVDGVRLHYVERGSGTPVVLLHGNGVTLQDFEASGVFDLAVGHYRVLSFDRPGFGYSERPRTTVWTPQAQAALIAKALAKLEVERAVVVGHSWGTLVALAMALNHPESVRGLVLLSGVYYGTLRPDVIPASLPAIPVFGDIMAHTVSPLTGALMGPVTIKASFAPAPVPDKVKRLPLSLSLRPSQIRATAADTALMEPGAISLSRRYAELSLPVVIMAGDGDLIAHPNKHAERLVGDIAGSDLRIVPGQGHLFHYAVPDQVLDAIGTVAA